MTNARVVYIIYTTMSFIRKIKRGGRIYLAEVENQRVNGKVVQKHLRYIGTEADGQTKLASSISDLAVDSVKVYGPLLVLHHLAREIDLTGLLGERGKEILSLVLAHCLNYQSVSYMPQWYERTDLDLLLGLDDLTEERLLTALDSLESHDSTGLQKKIFGNVQRIYRLKGGSLLYDITNTYLYGRKCPLGKRGKDKEGKTGRPLIQIGLAVTKDEGIPVIHKVYDGNVHDSKTLPDLMTALDEFHITKGCLVFDRGIHSRHNHKEIKQSGWSVLCGMPLNPGLKRYLRTIIAAEEFLRYENRIRLNNSIFYVIAKPYAVDSVSGTIAICFNEQHRKELRESRYDEITVAEQLLSQNKSVKPGMERFFDADGRLNLTVVQTAEEFDGYSLLFTTDKLTKQEMVDAYFNKDLIEKAFQSLKGVVRIQPIRHWLYNRVIAHIFICYLSYLLLSLLKYKLKKTGISPTEALKELATMYKVYLRDQSKGFTLSRIVTLTKRQERILKAVSPQLIKGL